MLITHTAIDSLFNQERKLQNLHYKTDFQSFSDPYKQMICQTVGHSFRTKNLALMKTALQSPKSWQTAVFLWWLIWLMRTGGKPTCIGMGRRSWQMSKWQKKWTLIAWMWALLISFEFQCTLCIYRRSNSKSKTIMTEQSFLLPFHTNKNITMLLKGRKAHSFTFILVKGKETWIRI